MDILLSIRPKYVTEIITGNKKYEFRKCIWKCRSNLDQVYIYSSSPVKKIIGAFTVRTIIEDSPTSLWNKFKESAGVDKHEFFNYFRTCKTGFAIEIKEVKIFKQPREPKLFVPNFIPPQSFSYLHRRLK